MHRDQHQRDFARLLRNQPTEAEKRLWWDLRAEKLCVRFRPQAAVRPYLVDFACFSHNLVVQAPLPSL